MLFHGLVASAQGDAAAEDALAGVRSYVEHFFGCGPCRVHFLAITARDPARAVFDERLAL